MNLRKALYFGYKYAKGSSFPRIYEDLVRQDHAGIDPGMQKQLLSRLLAHCHHSVPYYTEIMKGGGGSFEHDPESYLLHLPILTKELLRTRFDQLKSTDLASRRWFVNFSGGSTGGEPTRMIQDQEFGDRSNALQQFYSSWTGTQIGDPIVYVWGSERDIEYNARGGDRGEQMKRLIANGLMHQSFFNAFHVTPEKLRKFLTFLNARPPKLIIAYVDIMYEMSRFALREKISMRPQEAIITSAGTLTPIMRETIENVFKCKVFDRYGTREVGDIAGECKAHQGLHIFPWGSYVEIVDDAGERVPAGTEGNILVTCVSNYAMPLVRYQIGDRGILSTETTCSCGRRGQILEKILGRNDEIFVTKDGTQIEGFYFGIIMSLTSWALKYQIIQKSYTRILYKVILAEQGCKPEELNDIISKTRMVMGADCQVDFEFVEDIPKSPSGKYRYILSEVNRQEATLVEGSV
jgi:phenylacetate-coenzyme A ligase PaaK-like adenylate-forming protein